MCGAISCHSGSLWCFFSVLHIQKCFNWKSQQDHCENQAEDEREAIVAKRPLGFDLRLKCLHERVPARVSNQVALQPLRNPVKHLDNRETASFPPTALWRGRRRCELAIQTWKRKKQTKQVRSRYLLICAYLCFIFYPSRGAPLVHSRPPGCSIYSHGTINK